MRCIAIAATLAASASLASAQTFVFPLSGAQEVPAVTTTGTGNGTVTLSGSPGAYIINYTVTYSNLQGPIVNPPGAHIHNAAAGANGGVVHNLDGIAAAVGTTSGTFVGDWRFDDTTQPLTNALVNELLAGRLYFNLHTSFMTSGEIRGQIVPEPTALAALAAPALLMLRRRR
jgi:hypothetical protein